MKHTLIIIMLLLAACTTDEWCTCEITTDGDEQYITFIMRGCQYCCWYATIERCDLTQVDSIGNAFYQATIEDDPVCDWEGVDWTWEYGRVIN